MFSGTTDEPQRDGARPVKCLWKWKTSVVQKLPIRHVLWCRFSFPHSSFVAFVRLRYSLLSLVFVHSRTTNLYLCTRFQMHDHVATNSRSRHCLRPSFTSLRLVRRRDHGALGRRCSAASPWHVPVVPPQLLLLAGKVSTGRRRNGAQST